MISHSLTSAIFTIFSLGFLLPLTAETEKKQSIKNVGTDALTEIPQETRKFFYAPPKDLKWFEDAKFGIFVHWNPSSLVETEISWGRKGPRPGINMPTTTGVPEEEYNNLYKKFNPTKFNADEWIKMIKEAGAKYFIFTTKHHDGFCMFDANNTEYKITNTPFGRDVCKELADACHKYDIKLFWYYSKPDWHHPDYLTKDHQKYREYAMAQIRQLLTDYGKVDGIWFDCLNTTWQHWNTPTMVKMIRTLQPGILINSRWGWGMPGVTNNGDFDNPEQKLGTFKVDRPWETCAPRGRGWSWRGGGGLLSEKGCIQMLVQCVGAGGNLALDAGPRPDGLIDPPEIHNYLAMGKWLKQNGESIYGTRGGPYKPGLYGVSCHKENSIFLHIFATFPKGAKAQLELPSLPDDILKVQTLGGETIPHTCENGKLSLDLSQTKLSDTDTIVVIKLKGKASAISPIEVDADVRITPKSVTASSQYGDDYSVDALMGEKKGKFTAGIHRSKVWVARGEKGKPQWVEMTFQKPELVKGLSLSEPSGRFLTRKFEIAYLSDGVWKTIYTGSRIAGHFSLIFEPVRTEKIRVTILEHEPNDPGLKTLHVFKAQ
jgi:alpha-L-fucosidase